MEVASWPDTLFLTGIGHQQPSAGWQDSHQYLLDIVGRHHHPVRMGNRSALRLCVECRLAWTKCMTHFASNAGLSSGQVMDTSCLLEAALHTLTVQSLLQVDVCLQQAFGRHSPSASQELAYTGSIWVDCGHVWGLAWPL